MKASHPKFKSVFLTTTLFCLACVASHAAPIDVFILAGQSNAAGRALSTELSTNLDSLGVPYNSYAANSDSVLYANREREVSDLSIIHDQPLGDLRIKDYILPWRGELGVELSLARDLADASFNPVAFIKYTVGGTDIDRWDGPGGLYPDFYDYLSEMKAELTAAGHTVQWRGVFWVQGENDAFEERAPLYTTKFNQLSDRLRTDLSASDLPFVMAQLKSNLVDVGKYTYSKQNSGAELINSDMAQLASVDPLVAITDSSNDLLVRDGIHYTADDYIELGHRLAETYLNTWHYSADFGCDTIVDGADFLTWQRNFGSTGASATHAKGDANEDGIIDGLDLRVWESQFDAAPSLHYSADFNCDTVVDGADFLNWQRNFGSSGASSTHAKGDANRDSFVDGLDFGVWESQFGGAPSLAAASVVVPEPSSLLLVLTTCLIGCSRRRRG